LGLSGCGYFSSPNSVFHKKDTVYRQAQSIPPLRIPPGVNGSNFHNDYPIPERNYPPPGEVSLIPPGLNN